MMYFAISLVALFIQALFLIAKLFNQIVWEWVWVLSPMWIFGIVSAILMILFVITLANNS